MTIKDIAKLSGYGIGTVSRVINNQTGVSEKAKERILEVIKESNYEPNENARFLKMRNGSMIGIIIKGNNNMLFADIIEKIQMNLSSLQEDSMVEYIDEDGDEIECALRLIRDRNLKGILFLGADVSLFDNRVDNIDIPAVILTTNGSMVDNNKISSISVDDEQAAYDMMCYIIKNGHKKIGVIGGTLAEKRLSFSRYKGCKKGLQDNGISFDSKKMYKSCRYSMEDGYETAKKFIEENTDISAIFALSDTIAVGVIRAINDSGLRVPEDISVAGFDGIIITKYINPRITTICQNTDMIAKRGVELLLKHIHYDIPAEHESASYTLIEAESIKKI